MVPQKVPAVLPEARMPPTTQSNVVLLRRPHPQTNVAFWFNYYGAFNTTSLLIAPSLSTQMDLVGMHPVTCSACCVYRLDYWRDSIISNLPPPLLLLLSSSSFFLPDLYVTTGCQCCWWSPFPGGAGWLAHFQHTQDGRSPLPQNCKSISKRVWCRCRERMARRLVLLRPCWYTARNVSGVYNKAAYRRAINHKAPSD